VKKSGITPKSVIVYLLPYFVSHGENLSSYATSLDYHLFVDELNEKLIKILKERYPCNEFLGFGDRSPIDERHAGLISGLGIAGDNGLLINEKYGSYVFIADIVSDLECEALGESSVYDIKHCESCGACRLACPTKILSGKGTDCLSAITQKKGTLTKEDADLMIKFNTVWGCDLCQSSCPHNKSPKVTPIEFFHRDRIIKLTKELLGSMSDSEFSRRAFAWRKRETVERNLSLFD
jgi:epoxyqueuosine reductase